jgi:hypothetical protein
MANIKQTEWRLNQPCPCDCGGQGSPVFLACPSCGRVILLCEEIGTVFLNPKDLTEMTEMVIDKSGDAACPKCSETSVRRFKLATSDQIQALGFQAGDYM